MLAGIAQGPGFPNLSCLGLLADRILLNIDARMGKHHRLIMSNLLHPKVFPILTMRSLVVYKEVIRMTLQADCLMREKDACDRKRSPFPPNER